MASVLVLEDEADVRELLILHLKREGYEVSAFEDTEQALVAFQKHPFDLMILDWMLPKMSGLDFCKKIRTEFQSTIPVLLLTARADTMDKVLGLEMGADDYLTKPFEIREFVARVRALLRRTQSQTNTEWTAGPFRLNDAAKQIFMDGKELLLTPNEFKLLSTLLKKPGTTFERGDLISLIQGPGVAVVDRTIDTTVLGLRKKLGAASDYIETVRGFGYRLKGE
jgi:two-component system phosphate regulon response regulator PhoB